MRDDEGAFGPWQPSATPCPRCRATTGRFRPWESHDGAYEDYLHECDACGHRWWIDGIDS
jgi:hypothetical protein